MPRRKKSVKFVTIRDPEVIDLLNRELKERRQREPRFVSFKGTAEKVLLDTLRPKFAKPQMQIDPGMVVATAPVG